MLPLLTNWRTYVVLALLSLGGWGGWSANTLLRSPPAPTPLTNTVVVEKVVTRTVVVTRKPDGTETTTTTETQTSTNTTQSKPAPVVIKPKWSAEALAAVKPRGWELPKPTWSSILYHRVGDTNAWLGGGYDFGNKAALLAVRVDF